jgi:hypothetical protein
VTENNYPSQEDWRAKNKSRFSLLRLQMKFSRVNGDILVGGCYCNQLKHEKQFGRKTRPQTTQFMSMNEKF